MTKVLITGMSGLIGGLLRKRLEEKGTYELTALNRRPIEGVDTVQADIADLDAIRPAFEGQDVVVHLAGWPEEAPWDKLLNPNVIGVYNMYEASRQAGVKRVVFGSSGATVAGWSLVPPYDALNDGRYGDVPSRWPMITHESVRPLGIYGATKVWGEALGRHYSDAYGISVICVRIGAVPKDDRPGTDRQFSVWLSHRDVVQVLERSIEAPNDVRYDIVLATSRNKWGYRDLEHAREALGYEPEDTAEDYR